MQAEACAGTHADFGLGGKTPTLLTRYFCGLTIKLISILKHSGRREISELKGQLKIQSFP